MASPKLKSAGLLIFSLLVSLNTYALDWFSVQDKEVLASKCFKLQSPTKDQMIDFLTAYQKDPDAEVTEKVGPFEFVNESPELIQLFKSIHSHSYRDLDLSSLERGRQCKKVLCALEENYGNQEALQMLYIQARFGFPTSPLASGEPENYQKWNASDLDVLILGLESLPPQFFPIRNRHLLHFLEGYTYAFYGDKGPRVMANAMIEFFDLWGQQTKLQKLSILVHEFGHVVGSNEQLESSREWKTISKSKPISAYGQQNNIEDFAESFVAYRFAPRKLRTMSPNRYQFIKKYAFKGLEFENSGACENVFSEFNNKIAQTNHQYRLQIQWAQNNQASVKEEVERLKNFYPFEKRAYDRCLTTYLKEVEDRELREDTISCIKNVFVERAIEVELAEQNKDSQRTLTTRFKNIEVSRYYLNNVRIQLRDRVVEEFEEIYKKLRLSVNDSASMIRMKVDMPRDKSPLFKIENQPYTAKVLEKGLALKKKRTWRAFFSLTPDFDAVLP